MAIEKTISYLLRTIRNGSRMEFQKKIDTPNVLEITENFGEEPVGIVNYQVTEPHMLLGILTVPEEDSGSQITRLKEQAKQWANSMASPLLNMRDIRESYRCQLIPRIAYPMVTLKATVKQLEGGDAASHGEGETLPLPGQNNGNG